MPVSAESALRKQLKTAPEMTMAMVKREKPEPLVAYISGACAKLLKLAARMWC